MTRYWIAVASKEHVQKAIVGGFAQVCHGKAGRLNNMSEGDFIIYYSPTQRFQEKEPCRAFTAIGKILPSKPYIFMMSADFTAWRRDVHFLDSQQTLIEPLLEGLSFIKDIKKWGFPFRRGCFEISYQDFKTLATALKVLHE